MRRRVRAMGLSIPHPLSPSSQVFPALLLYIRVCWMEEEALSLSQACLLNYLSSALAARLLQLAGLHANVDSATSGIYRAMLKL